MTLPLHKKNFLEAVGFQPDEIAAVEQTMTAMAAKAQQQGIKSKEVAAPPKEETQEPVKGEEQKVATPEQQADQVKELLTKALEPLLTPLYAEIKSLKDEQASIKAGLQQQQASDTTPAASLAAKSITEQTGDHQISGRLPDKTPLETKGDPPVPAVTGIPFLDNILALNGKPPVAQ